LGPQATASEVRSLAPSPQDVEADVRSILAEVRTAGDSAVRRIAERFAAPGSHAPERLRVDAAEIAAAPATQSPEVRDGLRAARAAVAAVARAALPERPVEVEGPHGQRVHVAEIPVRRAAAYVPGGRSPYPSTVVMCAESARVAGVEELAVCAPAGADGRPHRIILAACAMCGVDEVYVMGGAQAIGALAFGTEQVRRVDVIVGPGSPWVQEAKRQVVGQVGIDGVAGPSELVVVATRGAEPELVAVDLLAQGEHGPDSPLVLVSPEADLLAAVESVVARRAPQLPTVADACLALVEARDARAAVALADAIAPEHLELVGEEAEALAGEVRAAGCLFVGRDGATAFGDYVAGSNHVLPTGGAARFASALGPATFRRRMARVWLPPGAAARLAAAGADLARAEGFPVHALSMEERA
jgi:histidinol dehydrogenase